MKRGHYGSGTIAPSGKGSWRIRYRIEGVRFTKTVKGSRTEAARELRNLLKAGDDGVHVAPSRKTLAQWITDWLALKERSLKARTIERYTELLQGHVVPMLGAIPVQKLSTTDFDELYGALTLAPSTMQVLHTILKACLNSAVKKKLRANNPVADAEKPAGETTANEVILDEEELGRLVKGFEGQTLYPIVATAAFTGMRRNEMLALPMDRH
jgi:integrase